jgi:hypothetical protein
MTLFRERILARLLDRHAISRELVQKLLAWRHPGFSEPIGPEDEQRLEDTGAYLVRNPLSLRKLVYLDGQQAVLYRSRMNPPLGRDWERQRPEAGELRLDEGRRHYANRVRGARQLGEAGPQERSAETSRRRWDAMRFTNSEAATAMVRPEYRKGYALVV